MSVAVNATSSDVTNRNIVTEGLHEDETEEESDLTETEEVTPESAEEEVTTEEESDLTETEEIASETVEEEVTTEEESDLTETEEITSESVKEEATTEEESDLTETEEITSESVKEEVTTEEESVLTEIEESDLAASSFAWEDLICQEPAEGNVLMGFSGSFYTETAEKILKRLNEIRFEACSEGVTDPNTGKALTEDDYVPLQWSSDLEAIARLRAAEAAVLNSHTRPNNKRCFSIYTINNESSWAENLAWNYSGIMYGIEQWYDEKDDWVNNGNGVTGHYESLISTRYNHVAIGCFRLSSGGWYSVAQEFSYKTGLDTAKDNASGNCIQYIEVDKGHITNLEISDTDSIYIEEEQTKALSVNAEAYYNDYYGSRKNYSGPVSCGGIWTSSDESAVSVDNKGVVTAVKKGTATIQMAAGDITDSITINVYGKGESLITVQPPAKTTYKIGETLSLTGGKVTSKITGESVALTKDMISGFQSEEAGLYTVSVAYKGYTGTFDVLIIEEPHLIAQYGQTLAQVELPKNDYGHYMWEDSDVQVGNPGLQKYQISFVPDETEKFQVINNLQAEIEVFCSIDKYAQLTLTESNFVYSGIEQEPELIVKVDNIVLVQEEDYTVVYADNKNAGTAKITVTGQNYYQGTIEKEFFINQAKLTITAKNVIATINDSVLPKFEYEVEGLIAGEKLETEPVLSCNVEDMTIAGVYEIIPGGAVASSNYDANITYKAGKLVIAEERVAYTVTFNLQGHGEEITEYIGVKAGNTIPEPEKPKADGYDFGGWYKDTACTKIWDFNADIVQEDITLYAGWLIQKENSSVSINEVPDVYYTGKACKPAIQVYDEGILLKNNKDYKIVYYNNIVVNVNAKKGNGVGENFDPTLPYVQIIGKGNYANTLLSVNFNILPVTIGNGSCTSAKGITVKYNQQMIVNSNKELNPFISIKSKKALKKNVDYELELITINAYDEKGGQVALGTKMTNSLIPKGYTGSFQLVITGKGNYTGSISTEVYVSDKKYLMKNTNILLGKNLKKIKYNGNKIVLTPGYYDSETKKYYLVENGKPTVEVTADDVFVVKYGKESLIYQKDFTIDYQDNIGVGRASVTITGKGKYLGSKTITFQIVGTPFNAKNVVVDGLSDKVYTGNAWIQNNVVLTYDNKTDEVSPLVYGKHYVITYKNNIKKGTATVTFTALTDSGYEGKFSKSFKILAADVNDMTWDEEMKNISVEYQKGGVRPYECIKLTQPMGMSLTYNKDYSVSYKNNKTVADSVAVKAPVMVVKGKGNYKGTMEIPFTITEGDLSSNRITMVSDFIRYNAKKASIVEYKPAIKVSDGKNRLSVKKDYEIIYVNNTQEAYESYLQKYKQGIAGESDIPKAVITQAKGSNYKLSKPIEIPLAIYENKLSNNNIYVVVGEAVYNGTQIKPAITVYYSDDMQKIKMAKGLTTETDILALGLCRLEENTDYFLTYGLNVTAGKKKGSVKISGISPCYGGEVTVKFTIDSKKIVW